MKKALPATIAVFTKPELIEFERKFQAAVSSAGPIFAMGTIVGFVVGMLISYQVTYTDLADQLPQYATLKAIGYQNRLSFARRARTSLLQCPGRLDPGITGEHFAISHHWSGGIAAPAHDGENYVREPRTDLGDVLDLGCDRGRPRDQGRSRRGILMGAALEQLHVLCIPSPGRRIVGLGGGALCRLTSTRRRCFQALKSIGA